MPDKQPRTQVGSRKLARYTQIARGSWRDISGQGHHAAIAALETIATEIAAARELAQIHDIVSALAGIQGLDRVTDASLRDSLVNRSGGVRVGPPDADRDAGTPDLAFLGNLPTHSGTGGSRGVRYRPNLSIGFGGIASQDGRGPVNLGRSTGASGTIARGSDGSVVITRTEKFDSGASVTTSATYEGGNVTRSDWRVTDRDGSSTWGGTVNLEDGGRLEYKIHTDADGNVTSESYQQYDAKGNPVEDTDVAGQPGVDGEGEDSDLARYFRAWYQSVYGPATLNFSAPVLVNPGSPEAADAARVAPGGINLGDSLVINPDPNGVAGPPRQPSAEDARRMKDQLNGAGTPGPNPGPRPAA